jgi:hypothetical protein
VNTFAVGVFERSWFRRRNFSEALNHETLNIDWFRSPEAKSVLKGTIVMAKNQKGGQQDLGQWRHN